MKPTQQPTEIDIAQMATIIDCEGHIAISLMGPSEYSLQVTIGNKDFRLLEWCQSRFGGAIYRLTYKKEQRPALATVKRWRTHGREAGNLLQTCLPYFIIKREQAEIGLKFIATYKIAWERVGESTKLLREELRQELLAITATGPRAAAQEREAPPKRKEQSNLFTKEISN